MGWALILAAALTGQPTIDRALTLLDSIGITPNAPLQIVHRNCSRHICEAARIDWDHGIIEINDAGKPALKGDAVAMAGVLAHEFWHIANGTEEASAYNEQIRILRLLNANKSLIRDIESARDFMTRY